MAAEIELRGIEKRYRKKSVLLGLDLSLQGGEFSVIMGPPASGKSVLMRLLIGLEQPDAGTILVQGKDVTRQTAGQRYFGYVPQSFALYPHYTVFENIAYPLVLAKQSRDSIDRRVREFAERLRIDHLLNKYPNLISGGEKQRVALARGMIRDASVYVLDDPLVGLDFKLREQLFIDLREMLLSSAQASTFVYTTSDPLESLAMADRICILDEGSILDSERCETIYQTPGHLRTLELLGYPTANVFSGMLASDDSGQACCETAFGKFPVILDELADRPVDGTSVTVGIRPEGVCLSALNQSREAGESHLEFGAKVVLREDLGAELLIYLQTPECDLTTGWTGPRDAFLFQDEVHVRMLTAALLLFSTSSRKRIGRGLPPSHV